MTVLADLAPLARRAAAPRCQGRVRSVVGLSFALGPTVGGPIAMGYVERAHAEPGTRVVLVVREKELIANVVALPFVPHRYYRGA